MKQTAAVSNQTSTPPTFYQVAPTQVCKGSGILSSAVKTIATLGKRPLVVGGKNSLKLVAEIIASQLDVDEAQYSPDCSENSLARLHQAATAHEADLIVGVGGGKALDTAKLLAYQLELPIVTIPTSAATCAAWTALSNIYTDEGAFRYDVALAGCPNLLVLDYDLIATAPERTLIAGVGDAIAKWYEASVSSGSSTDTLTIAAVQQARILRDILMQKAAAAIENPGGEAYREVVDANVLLAGVIGGLGGANCRTVAAHAVHNGLTHLEATHNILHGEKVAYGILVQLRLEEMISGSGLAAAARGQLLQFYSEIGLPCRLEDLGLEQVSLADLRRCAAIVCQSNSDIHRLPFAVTPEELLAAMVSTTVVSGKGAYVEIKS